MKLTCPNCQIEIPSASVNVAQGVCHCSDCNQVFSLASFASAGSLPPKVEKPDATRIESYIAPDSLGFILPRATKGIGLGLMAFTLFWNGFLVVFFSAAISADDSDFPLLFMIPFVVVGLGLAALAIFFLFGRTSVLIDRDEVRLARDLFGKSFVRRRKTSEISKVSKMEIYSQNHRPVYGVGIEFNGARPLKFGSQLSDQEKDWIISEIDSFWRVNRARG